MIQNRLTTSNGFHCKRYMKGIDLSKKVLFVKNFFVSLQQICINKYKTKKMRYFLLITFSLLLLCACGTGSGYGTEELVITNNDSIQFWKRMYVENGQKIILLPKYVDGKTDIDSVRYYWEDKYLVTIKEMPFASETTINVDSTGIYELHNVVFYHGAHSIDYYILYTVR